MVRVLQGPLEQRCLLSQVCLYGGANLFSLRSAPSGHRLFIVLERAGTVSVNKNLFQAPKGSVFVIDGSTDAQYSGNSAFEMVEIDFDENLLRKMLGSFKSMRGYQALFVVMPCFLAKEGELPLQLALETQDSVRTLFKNFLSELEGQKTGYQQICDSMFLILITLLSRCYEEAHQQPEHRSDRLAHAVAYIQAHFCEELRVEDLARRMGFSVRHFSRLFVDAYGVPPQKYILLLRLERARELLSSPDMSVTEIALSCGFSDCNYFIRIFKKYYSMTPMAVRKLGGYGVV